MGGIPSTAASMFSLFTKTKHMQITLTSSGLLSLLKLKSFGWFDSNMEEFTLTLLLKTFWCNNFVQVWAYIGYIASFWLTWCDGFLWLVESYTPTVGTPLGLLRFKLTEIADQSGDPVMLCNIHHFLGYDCSPQKGGKGDRATLS
jgi:hypothetical protein